MLMSRPIDRFLFAAPGIQSSSLVFLAAKKKKTERKRNLSILSPRKFTRAAKRGASRFGKIERKVLSRGNWIENSRKGTMDTKVHRVPSPPPLDPFFPLPRCGEKRFDIRTRTVKLSLARVLAFWSGTCQGTAALTERGSPPSQVAVQFYQGAYRS